METQIKVIGRGLNISDIMYQIGLSLKKQPGTDPRLIYSQLARLLGVKVFILNHLIVFVS